MTLTAGKNKTGITRTLLELQSAIILFELLCFMIGIWFVPQKGACALGLLIGTVTALLMAFHMSWSYDRYFDYPEKTAKTKLVLHGLLRYFGVAAVLAIVLFTGFANPLTTFLGIMGLKAGAYLQPLIHRFTVRKYPDPEPAPSLPEEGEVHVYQGEEQTEH